VLIRTTIHKSLFKTAEIFLPQISQMGADFSDFYLCNLRNLRSIPFGCGSAALYYYPQEFVQTAEIFTADSADGRRFFLVFICAICVICGQFLLVAGRLLRVHPWLKHCRCGSAALGPFAVLFPVFGFNVFHGVKFVSLT